MNVHILSDTPRALSAYSKITRNLSHGLVERGHNVTITGFLNGYENFRGIDVLPLATPFTHPQVQFANNLKSSKAEVLICIHEAHGDTNVYSQMFSPTFFWVPVEGEGIPQHMSRALKAPSLAGVVAQSHAGKKELEAEGIDSRVIYLGYDPEVFTSNPKPCCRWSLDIYQQMQDPRVSCERGCLKCEGVKEGCRYFENERVTVNVAGKEFTGPLHAMDKVRDNFGVEYVIGCVAQNVGLRKRMERLIEAFSKMENKKDALLHLHTLPASQRSVVNLFEVARKFNVLDKVLFSYGSNAVHGISDHGMNLLYNYFDIHATASSFEGFGLPVLESMSIGKPQAVPRCGTFPELLGENERGLLADIAASSVDADGITRSLVDVNSLSAKMDMLCINKSLRKKLGDAGAEWAKQFTWDKVVQQWDALLQEMQERSAVKKVEAL